MSARMTLAVAFVLTAAAARARAPTLAAQARPSLAELQARVVADSTDPLAHFNAAAALADANRLADAEHALRHALTLDPQYAPALLLLATVRIKQEQPGFILLGGRRVYLGRARPTGETARLARRAFLIDPFVELGPPSRSSLPVKWRETLGQGLRAYEGKRWADAMARFTAVVERTVRPRDSTRVPSVALWYRARAAIELADYDRAIGDLEWLLTLQVPDSSLLEWNPVLGDELRYVLAYVHQRAGRFDEAVRRYQDLATRHLGLEGIHSHLAEIYEAQERWSDAVEERRRAIRVNPDEPSLRFDLGSTLVFARQDAEAADLLARHVQEAPRESRAHYFLGIARARLSDYAGAREAFTRYLALAPSRYTAQIADAKQRLAALPDQGGTR